MINLGAQYENLDQKAYQIIKDLIMQRRLLPGDKIHQEKLAQDMGISRTPVVSALKFLEKEKLVESKPRRGFFVRLFSKQEMVSIFELREVLEGLAARRAAANIIPVQIKELERYLEAFNQTAGASDLRAYAKIDRSFHNFVTEVGSKEFLKSILQTYNIISFSYQVVSPEGLVRSPAETVHEHLAIITAICNKDPEGAEDLMRSHFRHSLARLKEDIGGPSYGYPADPQDKTGGGKSPDGAVPIIQTTDAAEGG